MATLNVVDLAPRERLVGLVRETLAEATLTDAARVGGFYDIEGMSGGRYRRFINRLIAAMGATSYLEVGSWMGSTLCAAHGNAVQALAIDNWSEFGGPRAAFLDNVARFRTAAAQVGFLEADFRQVDFAELGRRITPFEVYLFDGPHAEADQYDGLRLALPALARTFVFICDDWNWEPVRAGTRRAMREAGLDLLYLAEVRTSLDNTHGEPRFQHSDWHNGYAIAVLRQGGAMAIAA